jgi:hypothetical protein
MPAAHQPSRLRFNHSLMEDIMPEVLTGPDKTQADSKLPRIPSRDLNWLAEAASGLQGKALTVFLTKGEAQEEAHVALGRTGEKLPKGSKALFEVHDEDVKMVPPKGVTLISGTGKESNKKDDEHKLLEEHADSDALFWTPSAIEKFVIPYYVAHRLLDKDALDELERDYKAGNLVAILHVAPSKSLRYWDSHQVYPKDTHGLAGPSIDLLDYVKILLERKAKRQGKPVD